MKHCFLFSLCAVLTASVSTPASEPISGAQAADSVRLVRRVRTGALNLGFDAPQSWNDAAIQTKGAPHEFGLFGILARRRVIPLRLAKTVEISIGRVVLRSITSQNTL